MTNFNKEKLTHFSCGRMRQIMGHELGPLHQDESPGHVGLVEVAAQTDAQGPRVRQRVHASLLTRHLDACTQQF